MTLENVTSNQHFVSRVEQKLNALNPNAAVRKLKIYSFRVVDRANYTLQLESPSGQSIGNNMALSDLFSFDVDGSGLRLNFESLFKQYEDTIETHTRSLLAKLDAGKSDIKDEIIGLFASKLLNFVRNPYSIRKMLNTFPVLSNLPPTDPTQLRYYQRILDGRKPHQAHLCKQLGISDKDYIEWLRAIFILLMRGIPGRPNIFEGIIKGLFENKKTQAGAIICTYSNDHCLVCDRGFTQAIPDGPTLNFSFNLCSNAFIHYNFTNFSAKFSDRFSQEVITMLENRPEVTVSVSRAHDRMDMLGPFNQRAIDQCHERVYSSRKTGLVL